MKLRQKYFLSYLFFISLFSIFLIGFMTFFFSKQFQKEQLNSAEKTFSQTATLLNHQFKQYLYVSYMVSTSEEVVHAQNLSDSRLETSVGLQLLEISSMRNLINRSAMSLQDIQISLYIDNRYDQVLDHSLFKNRSTLDQYLWYETFSSSSVLTSWQSIPSSQEASSEEPAKLSLFRKINGTSSTKWICEIYIRQDILQDILSNADPTGAGIVFLQSRDNTLLSSTDEELSEQFLDTYSSTFRTSFRGGRMAVFYAESKAVFCL